jgi:hypothetical protein
MKPKFIYSARKVGAGTAVKLVIHKALDAVPTRILSAKAKRRIKACKGCQKREAWLNRKLPGRTAEMQPLPPKDAGGQPSAHGVFLDSVVSSHRDEGRQP